MESASEAFQDDPSTIYFCKPDRRLQFYRSVLSCLLDWYPEEKQLVCTLPPDAAAVVYVWPRLRPVGSLIKLLRGGLAPLLYVQPRRLIAGMDASDFFEGQREDFYKAHGPFLYVSVMAVRPERQRRGLGSALLAFICDRADAAGLHCYVEATSPRNQALYERYGFKLLQAWRANPDMPYTFILARPPKPVLPDETRSTTEGEEGAPLATEGEEGAPLATGHLPPSATTGVPQAAAAAAANDNSGLADVNSSPVEGTDHQQTSNTPLPPIHQQDQQQQPASLPAYMAQQRRRLFASRQRFQRQQQQQQGALQVRPYDEVDSYDMWPLWTSSSSPPAEWVELYGEQEGSV